MKDCFVQNLQILILIQNIREKKREQSLHHLMVKTQRDDSGL